MPLLVGPPVYSFPLAGVRHVMEACRAIANARPGSGHEAVAVPAPGTGQDAAIFLVPATPGYLVAASAGGSDPAGDGAAHVQAVRAPRDAHPTPGLAADPEPIPISLADLDLIVGDARPPEAFLTVSLCSRTPCLATSPLP